MNPYNIPMKNNLYPSEKFQKAKRRLDGIIGFYQHLTVYVLLSMLLLFCRKYIIQFAIAKGATDQGFLDWLEMHTWFMPLLWSLVIAIHALLVFSKKPGFWKSLKPKMLKAWENKQIEKYMNKDL